MSLLAVASLGVSFAMSPVSPVHRVPLAEHSGASSGFARSSGKVVKALLTRASLELVNNPG